ncbi:hypothetical protein MIND_01313300 [Mycena indigotica]|uniref:Uncharacterized protein n=1 Tax=Mycena indigotica TaxID=2126181 RepID=A0A8H6S296_9AGAR|nr:uncharacterized protein MIND_01313300 [Mycena indigotica]KAF7290726.1 hypothetical protein MIND_01313300 [Mycena indigotica]
MADTDTLLPLSTRKASLDATPDDVQFSSDNGDYRPVWTLADVAPVVLRTLFGVLPTFLAFCLLTSPSIPSPTPPLRVSGLRVGPNFVSAVIAMYILTPLWSLRAAHPPRVHITQYCLLWLRLLFLSIVFCLDPTEKVTENIFLQLGVFEFFCASCANSLAILSPGVDDGTPKHVREHRLVRSGLTTFLISPAYFWALKLLVLFYTAAPGHGPPVSDWAACAVLAIMAVVLPVLMWVDHSALAAVPATEKDVVADV